MSGFVVLEQCLDAGWLGGVMSMGVVNLNYLCRWQVHVSVYCARWIPSHLRCTQCSIQLHLIDICFLTCICLWQISQIQTCLRVVVGPGLVSTTPAFMKSSASHPARPHGGLSKLRVIWSHLWEKGLTRFASLLLEEEVQPLLCHVFLDQIKCTHLQFSEYFQSK